MTQRELNVLLLVEDNPADARLIHKMFKEGSFDVKVINCETLGEAETHLAVHAVDMILLDLCLPDAQGLESVRRVKTMAPCVPLVVLTALDDESLAAQALHAGAQDYLIKSGLEAPTLFRALRYAGERKICERELRESELRFRQIAENIGDVFYVTNLTNTAMFYISPAYKNIWGRSCESLYAKPESWMEAVHPEDREHVLAQSERQLTGNFDYEFRILKPDGEMRWIRTRGFPVLDEEGKPYRTAGVASDFTERRHAEDESREKDRRLNGMMDNLEFVSVMLDLEGRITYCNDFLLQTTGWQREEVIGSNWFEQFIPYETDSSREVFSALLNNHPKSWHHENIIYTRAGQKRLVRWNNSVLRSSSGDVIGTAAIGEDITEKTEARVRLARLNRVYAMLSGINKLIVTVRSAEELLREACRIASETGNFSKAFIEVIDMQTGLFKMVAAHGIESEYYEELARELKQQLPLGNGIVAESFRERRPVIVNDLKNDSRPLGKVQSLAGGSRSIVALPLVTSGQVTAVLVLHAESVDFFDEEEMKLLVELAGNISVGLEHIQNSEKLDYLAYYDPLTGLANRRLFLERVGQNLESAGEANRMIAVFVLDVERFKTINEALGREDGDALLMQIADRLRIQGRDHSRFAGIEGDRFAPLRDGTRLSRIAGDHFAGVSTEAQNEEQLLQMVDAKLKRCFGTPFRVGESEIHISAKIGIAVYPNDGVNAETLLNNATAAVKTAKAGSEQHAFYTAEMTERTTATLKFENKLRRALENDEFVLHYQPKVDVATRRIVGVEALIRWQSPDLGLVPPLKFIPLMEETGMIMDVGAWALSKAVSDHLLWSRMQLNAPRVAVNVSAVQLRKKDFLATILKAAMDGVNPTALDLEITESVIMEDVADSIQKLKEIREFGISLAIDDFGTGYSSLAYLTKLPVQTVKIDRSFINRMLEDPDTMTLVQSIISLAHSLRLKVVAEGVELEEQAKMLGLLRCDEMQGYLVSKPVPFDRLANMLDGVNDRTPPHGLTSQQMWNNHEGKSLLVASSNGTMKARRTDQ
ncbi:MAG: EAL domain-containing protein [Candidatus Sumerlaeaceae bacterium]